MICIKSNQKLQFAIKLILNIMYSMSEIKHIYISKVSAIAFFWHNLYLVFLYRRCIPFKTLYVSINLPHNIPNSCNSSS